MYLVSIKNGPETVVAHEWWPSQVKLAGAKISRGVNLVDSFAFTVYPGNPCWGQLKPFSTMVEVVNTRTGRTEFEGRVIQPVPSMDSGGVVSYAVTCEGPMGYLMDSHQPYVEEKHYADQGPTTGLRRFIGELLEVHNSRVEEYKRIYPGSITLQTFDTSGGVTKAIDRASTWDNIKTKLLDVFGGEMRVRRGSDGLLYLDYAERLGQTRATAIELGRNMGEAEASPDPSAVVTRLYPYGAKKTATDSEGREVETEERLDITSVNGGVAYIEDAVAIEAFGIIEGSQTWDDVTQASNLIAKARDWLGGNNQIPTSTKVTAVDLAMIGLDYDSFTLYDSYPVRNQLIGLDTTAEVVKQEVSVSDPASSTFELGDTAFTLSKDLAGASSLPQVIERIQSQTKTAIKNIESTVKESMASLEVMEDKITSNVTEKVTTTVSTQVDEAKNKAEEAREAAEAASSTASAAKDEAAKAAGLAADKSDVLIQDAEPEESYRKDTTLWIDTTEGANTPKRWSGSAWMEITDQKAIDAANEAAEAKQAADDSSDYLLGVIETNKNDTDTAISGLQGTVTDHDGKINEVYEITQTNSTKITEMTQTVDGWSFDFTTLTETVTQLGNDVSTEHSERIKYIKFIDGEIWLGADPEPNEDDFKVVISNKKVQFLQNNVEVAYISNRKMYITDAEVTNRMDLGNFAFFPRANGNLSFRHIGE